MDMVTDASCVQSGGTPVAQSSGLTLAVTPLEMKRIRKKLGLKQGEMVTLFAGGGHNSVSRYERGEVEPPKSLQILMRLLDRHPELLNEIPRYS